MIEGRGLFCDSARPKPLNDDSDAVFTEGCLIGALQVNFIHPHYSAAGGPVRRA